jgi:GAF domain-containing protein
MLREGDSIGTLGFYRLKPGPFSKRQVDLIESFADQAVIAIENTRLLTELRDSLQQQTATSEVLQVISSSPGELQPVFQAMLANAARICEASFGNLYLRDADAFRMAASHNDPLAYVEARTRDPLLRPPPDAPLGRLGITKQVVQIADVRTIPSQDHPFVVAGVAAGYRTVLAVPMLKDNELIGAFTLIRQEVRPFTDKQITLLHAPRRSRTPSTSRRIPGCALAICCGSRGRTSARTPSPSRRARADSTARQSSRSMMH